MSEAAMALLPGYTLLREFGEVNYVALLRPRLETAVVLTLFVYSYVVWPNSPNKQTLGR